MAADLKFLFQLNPSVPLGKVAVRPMPVPGSFLVLAASPMTDAQVTMAIARYVAKHDPNSGENRPHEDIPL